VVNGKATKPGAGSGSPSPGASGGPTSSAGSGPTGPSTGQPGASGPVAVSGQVVNVAAQTPNKLVLSVLTAMAIVLAVVVPPTLGAWLRRRRRQAPG